MIRSALFAPGSSPRMIAKALASDAGAAILDLEDAVSPDEKESARERVASALRGPARVLRWVRVNAVTSAHHLPDVEIVLPAAPDAIVLPKADGAAIRLLSDRLDEFEAGSERSAPPIVALVETCRGLLEAAELAAHPRVRGLLLGAEDLTAELGVSRTVTGEEIFLARQQIAIAATAFGCLAIDTPNVNVQDAMALETDLATAKSLGMMAKACIHPSQVPLVERAFAPSAAEVEWATRVDHALREALADGRGACALDGKMIDAPVAARARRILTEAAQRSRIQTVIKEEK